MHRDHTGKENTPGILAVVLCVLVPRVISFLFFPICQTVNPCILLLQRRKAIMYQKMIDLRLKYLEACCFFFKSLQSLRFRYNVTITKRHRRSFGEQPAPPQTHAQLLL